MFQKKIMMMKMGVLPPVWRHSHSLWCLTFPIMSSFDIRHLVLTTSSNLCVLAPFLCFHFNFQPSLWFWLACLSAAKKTCILANVPFHFFQLLFSLSLWGGLPAPGKQHLIWLSKKIKPHSNVVLSICGVNLPTFSLYRCFGVEQVYFIGPF